MSRVFAGWMTAAAWRSVQARSCGSSGLIRARFQQTVVAEAVPGLDEWILQIEDVRVARGGLLVHAELKRRHEWYFINFEDGIVDGDEDFIARLDASLWVEEQTRLNCPASRSCAPVNWVPGTRTPIFATDHAHVVVGSQSMIHPMHDFVVEQVVPLRGGAYAYALVEDYRPRHRRGAPRAVPAELSPASSGEE